ncbi:putative nucleotidyltransferase, ribonuclease H [Tanacetum coccineum]
MNIPTSSGFQNPITIPTEQTRRIVDSCDIWLIQNTCTCQGLRTEDPLHHVKHYLSIVDNIQVDKATGDTSRLRFFHFPLKGKAIEWLDRISPTQVTTWNQLVSRFRDHFFSVGRTSALRDLILRFKQGDDEPIKSAWFAQFRFHSLTEEEGWIQIEEYVQYQDDLWDDMSPPMNISSISETMQPTFRGRLKRACNQISYLETPTREVGLKTPYLICDYCGGSHEADECKQLSQAEQVCLSGGDIYDDPSLLRFYQNDDTSPWGNNKRKEKGEDGLEWIVRSKFEEELANFMLEKKSHAKGIGDMLVQHPMIHMPKGAKVLKDLLSHKEKLEKAASSVKLSEECSTIIQRSLPQKEGDPGSFTLPWISKLKPTKMSIQLADQSIKCPIGEERRTTWNESPRTIRYNSSSVELPNLELKKLPEHLDYAFLQEENQLSVVISSALSTDEKTRLLESMGKPCLGYPKEGRDDRSKEEKKWTEDEEEEDSNKALSVSFYPRTEPVEPLEWKALENRLKPSSMEPPKLKLKELPKNLELLEVLQNHKGAIAWSIANITGIDSSFCTHKILMEDEFKPSVQPQRRVNPNIKEVVKKEVIKLLDAGLIYPISDSPWVSPVQVVPKKGGMTVVKNEKDELILQRTVTGWRVCIDYRKLNNATRKDHFPLPFIDQMLERLAGHEYYCFLDGFSGYFQIPIAPEDQEKTTFTCPYGTFAYKRMPFGLCNAPATFQRCMTAIFHELIEDSMEVFMDDFSVFGSSFDHCLKNLEKMLKRCEETNLVLNWEKCHFMVKEGIVLGHKVSGFGIEVDKAKIEAISKLPYPTNVKAIQSFLGHAGFYRRFIKDFSQIASPMTQLLVKDAPFNFSEECIQAFDTLKRELTQALVMIKPDWSLPFEIMCDASDYAVGAIHDKKGAENLAADHLSRLENLDLGKLTRDEIRDLFPKERLMAIFDKNNKPWYADYANYLASRCADRINEDAWPEMKKHKFFDNVTADHPEDTMASPPPQGKSSRPGSTSHISFVMHVNWSKFTMHVSGPGVEAHAFPTSDARNVVNFLRRLFTRFGIPKALISNRGTHLCNYQIEKAMKRKLKSRWYGPFSVSKDMKNVAIELYDEEGSEFIVNKQRVKPYQKNLLDTNKDDDVTLDDDGEVTYFTFGRHLEELHVTWAHLEKKQTRLQTYTNISQDNVLCLGSCKTSCRSPTTTVSDDNDDNDDSDGNDDDNDGNDGNDGDGDDDDDANDDNDQEDDDKNDDEEETDSDRIESDNIKIPILTQSTTKYNEEEEEKIDDEENMDEEEDDEVTKELYNDVNVNLGNRDADMTDADKGGADQQNVSQESGFKQVEEDAHVTLTPVLDILKTDEPVQSYSVSSDFTSKLLNLENPSLADNEIASLMDTIVRHEEPGSRTSSLYTVPVTAVHKITSVFTTTIPSPPPFFNPLPQQATPTLTPNASEFTTLVPALLDFSSVFRFNVKVTNLEREF